MTQLRLYGLTLFLIPSGGMSSLKACEKRIADWKHNVANGIAKKRRSKDFALITEAEELFKPITHAKQLTIIEISFLQKLAIKDKYGPLLEEILKTPLFSQPDFQQTKNVLLYDIVRWGGLNPRPYENIKILVKNSATLAHARKINQNFFFAYIASSMPLLACFAGFSQEPQFLNECQELLEAAKHGRHPQWGNRDQANTLLYYGFNIPPHCEHCKRAADYFKELAHGPSMCPFCQEPTQKSFFDHAHPRRVSRLASYLTLCTNLPRELTFLIAEHHYGPLSKKDYEKIRTYPTDDYMTLRPKQYLNQLSAELTKNHAGK